jgi:hypothetical protein
MNESPTYAFYSTKYEVGIKREKVDIFTDLTPYLCEKREFFALASYLKSDEHINRRNIL